MNCPNTIYLKRICFCFSKIKGNVLWKRTSCLDTQSLKPINNSYLDVRIISDGCRRFSQDVTKGFGRSLSYPINNNGQNTNITPFAPYGLPSTILRCSLLPVDSFKYFMNVKDVIRGGGYNYCSIRYTSTNGRCSNNKNIGAKQTSSSSSEALKHSFAEGEEKLGLFQKFKKMFRDYWYVLIPVHCATYAMWFTGFYYMAESGVDIASVLQYFHVNESLIEPFKKGHFEKAGYFAVAFALCKLAAPLRYAVTVGLTTVSIKYLKLWGYIKPMPKKEQLKVMYKERKDIILEKKQQLQDNIFQRIKDIEDGKRKFHSKQKPPEST